MYFDPTDIKFNLQDALLTWLLVTGSLAAIVIIVSILSLLLTRGAAGLGVFFGEAGAMCSDIVSISPRRIGALAHLTFTEAVRRKAFGVFVVFGLLFMFASWFLGDQNEITPDRVKVYISFALTTVTWLTLPVVLILSCFGIPEDIRLRSIHTIVTKPARRVEIVIGRILGYSAIGTIVLAAMATVGGLWIVRQTPSESQKHLICRVPVYGEMHFLDRKGEPGEGLNVGDIWMYRGYIEGATKARALWTFDNVNESMLDKDGNLHLENSFSAFRSYKGDMTRTLFYDIKFVNPDTRLSYTIDPQLVDENRHKMDLIPRHLTIDDVEKDLIKDLVTKNGKLHLEVACIDREQYIGMARADLFIRMPDRPFWVGYFKAILGIEMTVIIIAMIGVAASSVVKGPIAIVLTLVLYLLSGKRAHEFMEQLATGQLQGGGVLESIYRLIAHLNPITELPANPGFIAMKGFDRVLTHFLWLCKQVIPQMQSFNMNEYVARGFDVPYDYSLLPSFLVMAAYFIPCVLLGYFALRIRELESK